MIGAILSGTSTDGTLGLDAIKADGRITFALDESARDDSMPRSAVAAGRVDFVLSPENIASAYALRRGSQARSLGEESPIRAHF
jgi:two-component system CheB/CheR fusion protein